MKKLFGLFLLVTALVGSASAGETFRQYVMAFGHVQQADGSIKNVTGQWVELTATRIEAKPINAINWLGVPKRPTRSSAPAPRSFAQPRVLTTVYLADAGVAAGYSVNGLEDASDLDGMQMTSLGVGKPWQNIQFGLQTPDSHSFLVRWIVYENFTSGLGAGVMAFSPYVANRDFGIWWNGPPPYWNQATIGAGTWSLNANIANFGLTCDQQQIYVAQQIRSDSDLTGEGPFDTTVKNVFNTNGPVNIGASDDTFYYDNPPADGIYDETEVDYFNEGPGNLLFGIQVNANTTTDNIQPYQFLVDTGTGVSGSIIDVWHVDQSYVKVSPGLTLNSFAPRMQLEFDGQAASTSANSIHFIINCAENQNGGPMRVWLYNYSTQAWVQVASATVSSTDTSYDITAPGLPANFISSTKQMRARVQIMPQIQLGSFLQLRVDSVGWTITR